MPTENERKFILNLSQADSLKESLVKGEAIHSRIRQGYLFRKKRSSLRIREKIADDGAKSFSMTYKSNVGLRVVELETFIEERDFKDLWNTSRDRLVKSRYDHYGWEYDFFLNKDKIYFVLAEHEMPEGQKEPSLFPALVQKDLIFEVPIGDIRFSSRKLSDTDYAKRLYKKVLKDFENARSRKRRSDHLE